MFRDRIQSKDDALLYFCDYTLANVAALAIKKTKSKKEFTEAIKFAQIALNFLLMFNIPSEGTRAYEVFSLFEGNVDLWAKDKENYANVSRNICN